MKSGLPELRLYLARHALPIRIARFADDTSCTPCPSHPLAEFTTGVVSEDKPSRLVLPLNPSRELKNAVWDIAFPLSWRHTTKTKSRFQKVENFPDSDFKDYSLCEVFVELEFLAGPVLMPHRQCSVRTPDTHWLI